MRELKFRAWDKSGYTMVYFANPQISYGNGQTKLVFGENFHDDFYEDKIDDASLMQFTGLLDRNGRDIYEGDIVRINHPADRTGDFTGAIGKVFWWNEEGAWYHTNNNGRPPKRMWEYVEVIGNIYEHPQLLQEGKKANE